MKTFFETLGKRNRIFYVFGWINVVGALICLLAVFTTDTQVLGINAFIKPVKFFVSTVIFVWTMGWLTGYLPQRRSVRIYSWVITLIFTFELAVIVGQAIVGQLSHFNISSVRNALLFMVMGIGITIAILWTAYIGFLFMMRRPTDDLPVSYLWGIRLGLLVFVVFAFEGGMMASRLAHTVGAPDGGPGLPLTNWSTHYGDLRIAHFFGMHALQLLPLFGYYIARRPVQVVLLAVFYVVFVSTLLIQALAGRPLLTGL